MAEVSHRIPTKLNYTASLKETHTALSPAIYTSFIPLCLPCPLLMELAESVVPV